MNLLLLNTSLAFVWAFVMGGISLLNLSVGFVIGYGALWICRPLFGGSTYFVRIWRVLHLLLFFLYELVVSSLRVVWDVITPTHYSRPGIIAMPLSVRGDGEILMVANLISLTPGTLSLDVSDDRRTLYVHAMFVDNPEDIRRELIDGMERKVIEAME